MTPAQRAEHERAVIAALPKEMRRAHKRILLHDKEADALALDELKEQISKVSMKMEIAVVAEHTGKVARVLCKPGLHVAPGQTLLVLGE